MKNTIFIQIALLTAPAFLFGQNIPKLKSDITISIIENSYLRDKNHNLTKKISNKKKNPRIIYYFSSTGQLEYLKTFGKHHNMNLKLIGNIRSYIYDNSNKLSIINIWETDYEKNISYSYYTVLKYDLRGNKLKETTFETKNDSVFVSKEYWYDPNNNYQGLFFTSTYFYEREYDSLNRTIKFRQIHDSMKRWEWNYSYDDSTRIGLFKTYYNDGKDYTKKEICKYVESNLVEVEEYYTSQDGLAEKRKYFYNPNGLISKIEYYSAYTKEKIYQKEHYSECKFKSKIRRLNKATIQKINSELIGNEE
jgi:hypothetical protein